jgi:hypothetical protein
VGKEGKRVLFGAFSMLILRSVLNSVLSDYSASFHSWE